MTLDELNTAVTSAILEAENADWEAAARWEKVLELEKSLVDANLPGSLAHYLALRGVFLAKKKIAWLKSHGALEEKE
jgi:hypothetical protein